MQREAGRERGVYFREGHEKVIHASASGFVRFSQNLFSISFPLIQLFRLRNPFPFVFS